MLKQNKIKFIHEFWWNFQAESIGEITVVGHCQYYFQICFNNSHKCKMFVYEKWFNLNKFVLSFFDFYDNKFQSILVI